MPRANKTPTSVPSSGLTVEQFGEFVVPSVWADEKLLHWPPDVFALVAALLLKSGAYSHAVSGWQRHGKLHKWIEELKELGDVWSQKPDQPPRKVRSWFQTLCKNKSVPVEHVCKKGDLCAVLIQLCAAADEACVGVGCTLLNPAAAANEFRKQASKRLAETALTQQVSTLCKRVHHSTVRVLPKLHTPQSGITIRSFTHNLALCPAGDVLLRKKPRRIICASISRFHLRRRAVRTSIIAGDWTNAKSFSTGWGVVLMLLQTGGNTYPSAIGNSISWCWTTG